MLTAQVSGPASQLRFAILVLGRCQPSAADLRYTHEITSRANNAKRWAELSAADQRYILYVLVFVLTFLARRTLGDSPPMRSRLSRGEPELAGSVRVATRKTAGRR